MELPIRTTSGGLFWSCLLWLVMLLPEATPLCPAGFFFLFGCTVSQDLEACCSSFRSTVFLLPLCSLTSSDNILRAVTRLSLSSSSVFMRSKSSSYEGVKTRVLSCSLSLINSCLSPLIASAFSLQPGQWWKASLVEIKYTLSILLQTSVLVKNSFAKKNIL